MNASRETRVQRREKVTLAVVALGAIACASAGCRPVNAPNDEPLLVAKARAAVAFAEAELKRKRPTDPQTTCDHCGGTGTVPSGDGLARVPCGCSPRCECRPAGRPASQVAPAKPRRKRLLYFTASWCATCHGNEPTLLALKNRGWRIGPGEENHVQIVDLDTRPDLQARYCIGAVPTWVLIDDGREIRRCCGVLDPFAVGRLFGD